MCHWSHPYVNSLVFQSKEFFYKLRQLILGILRPRKMFLLQQINDKMFLINIQETCLILLDLCFLNDMQ